MSQKPSLGRLIELQQLLTQFSNIERVTHRKNGTRVIAESDAEHSYNLAMSAWFLAPYFPELNADMVIKFSLIHDLVEVFAGDTYIYADEATLATKHKREADALKKLEQEWSDLGDMLDLITQYEQRDSREAQFVYALDKIMPIMMIYINDGHTWGLEGLTLDRLHAAKKDKVAVSADIAPYYDALYELLVQAPHLIPPK